MSLLLSRREWLEGAGSLVALLGLVCGDKALAEQKESGKTPLPQLSLPSLPYAANALEPFLDARTLEVHHGKHHAGYVAKWNQTVERIEQKRAQQDATDLPALYQSLAFNGSGHVLHALYWQSMQPARGEEPVGIIGKALEQDFGGIRRFLTEFESVTVAVEGSGWGVLAYAPFLNRLFLLPCEKHENVALWDTTPLLVCDVWEHAYYLSYQNRRADYVKEFLLHIPWKQVEERYLRAQQNGQKAP